MPRGIREWKQRKERESCVVLGFVLVFLFVFPHCYPKVGEVVDLGSFGKPSFVIHALNFINEFSQLHGMF